MNHPGDEVVSIDQLGPCKFCRGLDENQIARVADSCRPVIFGDLDVLQQVSLVCDIHIWSHAAALAIARCHHFAALWPEVEYLANAGLVGTTQG